jgi:hypothetical protein
MHWAGKLRGLDFELIEFRLPTIHTTKLTPKGDLCRPSWPRSSARPRLPRLRKRGVQGSRQLRAILDRPNWVTDWAIDCGWYLGQSPARKRCLRWSCACLSGSLRPKLVKNEGRRHVLTKEGQKEAKAKPKIASIRQNDRCDFGRFVRKSYGGTYWLIRLARS